MRSLAFKRASEMATRTAFMHVTSTLPHELLLLRKTLLMGACAVSSPPNHAWGDPRGSRPLARGSSPRAAIGESGACPRPYEALRVHGRRAWARPLASQNHQQLGKCTTDSAAAAMHCSHRPDEHPRSKRAVQGASEASTKPVTSKRPLTESLPKTHNIRILNLAISKAVAS